MKWISTGRAHHILMKFMCQDRTTLLKDKLRLDSRTIRRIFLEMEQQQVALASVIVSLGLWHLLEEKQLVIGALRNLTLTKTLTTNLNLQKTLVNFFIKD